MNLLEKLLSDFLTVIPKLAGAITLGRIVALDNTSVVLNAPDRQIIVPLSKLMRESVEILPNDFFQLPEDK